MTATESCNKCPRLDTEEAETLPAGAPIAMPPGTDSSEHIDWTLARIHKRIESNIYSMRDYKSLYMIVDKTLLCKAFLETKHKVIRLCAPRGIGKSFNIDTLKYFFAAVSKYDMPYLENKEFGRRIPLPEHIDSKVARAERMKLFHNTLLFEKAPQFFEEHFCRYQVVCLDFHDIDVSSQHEFNERLTWHITYAIDKFISGVDTSQLSETQAADVQKMQTAQSEFKTKLSLNEDSWMTSIEEATDILSSLLDMIQAVFSTECFILVDNYDAPLKIAWGKPWANDACSSYMCLLNRVFVDNQHLRKGLLVGVYDFPLDRHTWQGLGAIPTIVLATNTYVDFNESNVTASCSNMQAFGALFGYTLAEIHKLCSAYVESEVFAGYSMDGLFDAFLKQSIDYGIGCYQTRCFPMNAIQLISQARVAISQKSYRRHLVYSALSKLKPSADSCDNAISMANERRADMILLLSRLIHDFDTGKSSCFIRNPQHPGLTSVDDESLPIFMLDFECGSADSSDPLCLNRFVNQLLYNGYLSLGPGYTLRIANDIIRGMWEDIRLIATFGTWDQVTQDSERHELTASLYSGNIDILAKAFEYALTQLPRPEDTYSEDALLELACRYVVSKLSHPRPSVDNKCNVVADHAFYSRLYKGDLNWTITLLPYGRYIQKLVVCFEFVRIFDTDSASTKDALAHLADYSHGRSGHDSYIQELARDDLLLDLRVAIGHGKVSISKRV